MFRKFERLFKSFLNITKTWITPKEWKIWITPKRWKIWDREKTLRKIWITPEGWKIWDREKTLNSKRWKANQKKGFYKNWCKKLFRKFGRLFKSFLNITKTRTKEWKKWEWKKWECKYSIK